MQIITDANKLRKKSTDVDTTDIKKVQQMVFKMNGVLAAHSDGVGLAAPQVGILQRLFITRKGKKFMAFINPIITGFSSGESIGTEGCLSFPGMFGKVERPSAISLSYIGMNGQRRQMEYSGFEARVIQHEIDHLNGILCIDQFEEE